MKITLNWLKDHLDTTATLAEITDKLVTLGLEVESVANPADKYKDFVIARVVERDRHPNADRLSLCKVDVGASELVQVVCGAPNVRADMTVIFAPIGSTIPVNGMVLKPTKIRDVDSCGMLCSARELELGEDADGIMDLTLDVKPGTPMIAALQLDDPIIDVSLTPNRADCFGIRGIARDLAASGLGKLKPLGYLPTPGTFDSSISVHITDTDGCQAFQGCLIRGVKNDMSPDWVRRRLAAVGMRSISALVDVTNYITLDLGRPLHVFDASKIKGNLVVRKAKAGEKLLALNDKEYELTQDMTAVADDSEVLGVGGIMGGIPSSCTEQTTDVFIECALFEPVGIAKTGRALNIISDARTRFERGVDPASVSVGIDAATQLILSWCGGQASNRVIATQEGPATPIEDRQITLSSRDIKRLTGMEISIEVAKECLQNLEFTILSSTADGLSVRVPTHRLMDMTGPADLVEEILRLVGYDKLPHTPLVSEPTPLPTPAPSTVARTTLATRGLHEAVTWSFMSELLAEKFGGVSDSMRLDNPMVNTMAVLRPSILPNLIQAAVSNHARGASDVSLFEVGPQFHSAGQSLMATGLLSGHTPRHWATSSRPVDVFDAKAHVTAVLAALGVQETSVQIEADGPDYYHPGRKGRFKQGNRIVAQFGEIHPALQQSLDADQPMVGFEVFLDALPPLKTKRSAAVLSPYQPVTRDFAFVIKRTVQADDVIKAVTKVDRQLITSVQVFDLYRGDNLPEDMMSMAIQVRLEPKEATLTEAEIMALSDKIIQSVAQATGGGLRQS
jgi:phenylalanyl-tRNA synthetase beta chain